MKGFSFVHPPFSLPGNGLIGGPIGFGVGPFDAGASKLPEGVGLRLAPGSEKVILYAVLDHPRDFLSACLSNRHTSSLTLTLWVPIVRRHRRRSVAAPKVRQSGFHVFDPLRSSKRAWISVHDRVR